jgi:hypothetical protein
MMFPTAVYHNSIKVELSVEHSSGIFSTNIRRSRKPIVIKRRRAGLVPSEISHHLRISALEYYLESH